MTFRSMPFQANLFSFDGHKDYHYSYSNIWTKICRTKFSSLSQNFVNFFHRNFVLSTIPQWLFSFLFFFFIIFHSLANLDPFSIFKNHHSVLIKLHGPTEFFLWLPWHLLDMFTVVTSYLKSFFYILQSEYRKELFSIFSINLMQAFTVLVGLSFTYLPSLLESVASMQIFSPLALRMFQNM